ncbi:MAG TPA: hypothetical protein VM841_07440 [Actinomycetota bacterium]|nr:hypothetical protein [Actinomycetota bacterium]
MPGHDARPRRAAGRAVLVACALLASLALPASSPAFAERDLTPPGEIGAVRIRPVAVRPDGSMGLIHGDPKFTFTDPNRTVGDVEPPWPAGAGVPCTDPSMPDDCARTLASNEPDVNPSAGDGHTHTHTGDRWIIVNEIHGFARGDTIMIGSPSCDFGALGFTCRKYRPGFGIQSAQPNGEIAYVTGGDAGKGLRGPGLLRLRDGLLHSHPEGTRIVKLPTAYTGQQLHVVVPHEALLGSGLEPVTVTATLIPPAASRDPAGDRLRLPVDHSHLDRYERIVSSPAGDAIFYVPRSMTGVATIGRGFDIATEDTWYAVEIVSRDATGRPVAYGIARFKLNPVMMRDLRIDRTRIPPTYPVAIEGSLRDASSPEAANRPVEDATVEVMVTKPDGTKKGFYANACTDNDPGPRTVCGGDEVGYQPRHYGAFKIHVGGMRGFQARGQFQFCRPCMERNLNSAMDTAQQGTYRAIVSVYHVSPFVGGQVQWEVRVL